MAVALDHLPPLSRNRSAPRRAFRPGNREGKIIAIGNLKGGTGKSCLAVNLAGMFSSRGNLVCVADCDPQGTSAEWLSKGRVGATVEVMPVNEVGDVVGWLESAARLANRFDIVIADLPSVLSPAMASAFLLAHVILVPVTTSAVDIHGTRRVMRHLRTVREERAEAMPNVMLVPTRVPENQLTGYRLGEILGQFNEQFGPPLREREAFADAFDQRSWVGEVHPQSAAHADLSVLFASVEELLSDAPEPPLLQRIANFRSQPAAPHVQPTRKSWLRRIISLIT